jgi:hypothetical protein
MGSKSIKGNVVSYLCSWRPQRRRRPSLCAAQDQLFIKVNKFRLLKSLAAFFDPLPLLATPGGG